MQQINQIIKASQIDSDNKQQTRLEKSKKWSAETHKMVLGLFARFADLFDGLARSKGLEIKDEKGQYTRTFELWCKKLSDLTPAQIASGVNKLELRIECTVKQGEKIFPPSYSEFRGLCMLPAQENRIYRTWKGLPAPQMTNEEKKEAMKNLRKRLEI